MVITIDGPAGAGKTTAARALARALGFRHLDTGAMYRAVTLVALERGLDMADGPALARLAASMDLRLEATGGPDRVLADGRDVSEAIRTPRVNEAVARVATLPELRTRLAEMQRAFARGKDVVAEGRDMGTVVFPEAGLKIYLDADEGERARRRGLELSGRAGVRDGDLARVRLELARRDRTDRGRAVAPLASATDAVRVDSTHMGIDAMVAELVRIARTRIP
ncbi:MAG: (d)CMP kinase [Planctomycetes bacterium]|nr:(d)CMP kinase [Planctomycetota bacterium]